MHGGSVERGFQMTRLKVSGMTCEGCANAVRGAIARLASAAAVVVDLERGEVAISDDVDPAAAAAAIEAAGFGVARRGPAARP